MNVVSSNLANVNTTRTPEGGPYRKKEVIVSATDAKNKFGQELTNSLNGKLKEAKVSDVVEDQNAPKMVFEPGHPDANEQGYVAYPNINIMQEMVNLISASRSYEANITSINASKSLALKALELGR
jgi:flagellar basal-body rod protein FlgC